MIFTGPKSNFPLWYGITGFTVYRNNGSSGFTFCTEDGHFPKQISGKSVFLLIFTRDLYRLPAEAEYKKLYTYPEKHYFLAKKG
ncbi:MAG: hypothetical protein LUF85_16515 [Bacteroides sp.]|nr:hypothetical protein [Bacteroides sp.]